jgi:hypothetical protein
MPYVGRLGLASALEGCKKWNWKSRGVMRKIQAILMNLTIR